MKLNNKGITVTTTIIIISILFFVILLVAVLSIKYQRDIEKNKDSLSGKYIIENRTIQ